MDTTETPTPLVTFDTNRTRVRTAEGLATRILEELKNGPLVLSASRCQALAKFKTLQKKAGTPAPAYKTQRTPDLFRPTNGKLFIVALTAGPFERFKEVPEWVTK